MGRGAHKPTKLRELEGNLGKRPLPTDEPEPDYSEPIKPNNLSYEAVEVWNTLAPILVRCGLLTAADGHEFGMLCQAQARITALWRELNTPGVKLVMEVEKIDKAGNVTIETKINPLAQLEIKYFTAFASLAGKFGLSPRDRVGLSVGTGKKTSPGEDLLS